MITYNLYKVGDEFVMTLLNTGSALVDPLTGKPIAHIGTIKADCGCDLVSGLVRFIGKHAKPGTRAHDWATEIDRRGI